MNNRNGFTTIEVLIAMVILGITLVGTQVVFTDHFLRNIGQHDQQALALQLAKDRIELIQLNSASSETAYPRLDSLYSETDAEITEHRGFTRSTQVVPSDILVVGDETVGDFQRITVTVNAPGLRRPVSRTVSVGAP